MTPDGDPPKPDARPGHYYVSACNRTHYWLVSGPYGDHETALNLVCEARDFACLRDARGHYLAWGTCRLDDADEPEPGALDLQFPNWRQISAGTAGAQSDSIPSTQRT